MQENFERCSETINSDGLLFSNLRATFNQTVLFSEYPSGVTDTVT
ncbi:MAG: hypothetical protein ACJAYN_002473 [Bermanella sp.]|jgi:hypothetical protein